jgi:hypothetical protein
VLVGGLIIDSTKINAIDWAYKIYSISDPMNISLFERKVYFITSLFKNEPR